jgi:subtilisin-like proprotein convertase family protein
MHFVPLRAAAQRFLAVLLIAGLPQSASAQAVATFSNPSPILISDFSPAAPFPSTISVTGLTGVVVKVRVTLTHYSHSFPQDVTVWLVAPDGRSVVLLAGSPRPALDQTTLSFDDCAPRVIAGEIGSGPLPSGRYRPGVIPNAPFSSIVPPSAGTSFPLPTLAGLNGPAGPKNGAWGLYIRDTAVGDVGFVAGGWSLTFYTQPTAPLASSLSLMSPSCSQPDYDGDGRSDVAVYRPTTGEWFILQSSTNTASTIAWGAPASTGLGDVAVPGDYDGDGQTDVAIYRASTGTWFLRFSSGGSKAVNFGAPSSTGLGDTPVPGDYDGDGLFDFAVYRSTTGQWFVSKSNGAGVLNPSWGAPALGDYPARR